MRPDELRMSAGHFGEAGERLRAAGDHVAAVPPGDLGGPDLSEVAGGLLRRWAGAAGELDDLTTGAADRLRQCARAYENADGSALRSTGLL